MTFRGAGTGWKLSSSDVMLRFVLCLMRSYFIGRTRANLECTKLGVAAGLLEKVYDNRVVYDVDMLVISSYTHGNPDVLAKLTLAIS